VDAPEPGKACLREPLRQLPCFALKKRILITGGAGFIGSHLCIELLRAGYQVRVLDNFCFQVHRGRQGPSEILEAAGAGSDVDLRIGDMRSLTDVKQALAGVDVVYHLAAAVGVGQSMSQIKGYVSCNDLGTAMLLQSLLKRPIEKLIVASSMSIYGEGLYRDSKGRLVEDARREVSQAKRGHWELNSDTGDILTPIPTPETKRPSLASIYALTKFDQEQLCLLAGTAHNIPTVALRFFNVYGRGQALTNPYTGVVAIFASQLLGGGAPRILEDGQQRRDFVHVSDIVQACRLALECPQAAGQVFNVGSGQTHSILDVAGALGKALGKQNIPPRVTQEFRIGDIRNCFADISRAQSILGYRPQMDLAAGLAELASWLAPNAEEFLAPPRARELVPVPAL
jgi:dTDP-L-rhamnose 4-epimerase